MIGRTNGGRTYTVDGRALDSVVVKRSLRVQIPSFMKTEPQVDMVAKKAFGKIGFIGQCIKDKNWDVIVELCKTLVWLHLKYCEQLWPPC